MLIRNVKLVAGEERDWERYGSSQLRQSLRRRLYLTGFVTIDRQPGDADRFRPRRSRASVRRLGLNMGKSLDANVEVDVRAGVFVRLAGEQFAPVIWPGNNNSLSPTYDKTALDTFWPGQLGQHFVFVYVNTKIPNSVARLTIRIRESRNPIYTTDCNLHYGLPVRVIFLSRPGCVARPLDRGFRFYLLYLEQLL